MSSKISAPLPEEANELGMLTDGQRDYIDRMFRRSVRDAAELRAIIGARFLAARELNGFSQTVAAGLLEYETGTQLSLVEKGVRLPPLKLILNAAAIYAVSVDFLLGAIDEAEPDRRIRERATLLRHVDHIVRSSVEGITSLLAERMTSPVSAGDAWESLSPLIHGALLAFGSVRAANTELYESEFRGGQRLDVAMSALRDAMQSMTPLMQGMDAQYSSIPDVIKKHIESL
jgi:transcriptional regulator with XRE-family HTH domain